jgi:hypothetical protein
MYGQKGVPQPRRVFAAEWETKSFSRPLSAPWRGTLPASQLQRLLNGYCPSVMEEKWFVYADGPDAQGQCAVHMHRSWGGEKMFEMRVRTDGSGRDAEVVEVVWESDPNLLRWSSEEFAKATVLEVCNWVLDVQLNVAE